MMNFIPTRIFDFFFWYTKIHPNQGPGTTINTVQGTTTSKGSFTVVSRQCVPAISCHKGQGQGLKVRGRHRGRYMGRDRGQGLGQGQGSGVRVREPQWHGVAGIRCRAFFTVMGYKVVEKIRVAQDGGERILFTCDLKSPRSLGACIRLLLFLIVLKISQISKILF